MYEKGDDLRELYPKHTFFEKIKAFIDGDSIEISPVPPFVKFRHNIKFKKNVKL